MEVLKNWLTTAGLSDSWASIFSTGMIAVAVIGIAILANWVTKKWIVAFVHRLTNKTKNKVDDFLMERHVFRRLSHIVPALIILFTSHYVFKDFDSIHNFVKGLSYVYLIAAFTWVINSFLDALHDIYETYPISKKMPMKGIFQVVKIFLFGFAIILVFSVLLGKSPGYFILGLGTFAAVLMLVFQDTLKNLAASVQIMANNLFELGDWIKMSNFDADGNIEEINLTSVKVRNFDKTISTIPTFSLISSGVKNWQAMKRAGGRRIKRNIRLDAGSIKPVDFDLLERLKTSDVLKEYLEEKEKELGKEIFELNPRSFPNGRYLTNIGTFRKYIELYLISFTKLYPPGQGFTFIIRQLEGDENGIPLQVYCSTKTTEWVGYEGIQSDIFDHLYSIVRFFDLEVCQSPSSMDLREAAKSLTLKI